ncbi:MAG TPA: hypothetical protein EYQ11_01040 [Candidatus Poseidoniales archaeon]|jgi:hypothetical protein|nr:MAG: hypothetical protein CXT66_02730 [Euryarchaeota archaeon]HIG33453.1 hypothetical protein [Candidatus Poseidoniales archaeon]HIL67273.1 hypothetical protein [Candidatus Poseidoniales archaeon]
MTSREDETIVDKAIGNPAFDQMFGYQIFFRRAAIPVLLFLIGLLSYTIFDSFFSSQTTLTLSFIVVGLSLGPILNLERYMGALSSRK